jgi:hypothetical protein
MLMPSSEGERHDIIPVLCPRCHTDQVMKGGKTKVHIWNTTGPADVTPELKSELDQWDKASDEAWAMIERWEEEEQWVWVTFTGSIFQPPTVASSGAVDPLWYCKMTTTAVTCP